MSKSSRASNVRVVSRIRATSDNKSVVHTLDDCVLQVEGKRWFEMDAVFDVDSSQEKVYIQSGAQRAVCEDLFQGYHCTILAYGQTGSGKTYTMGTATQADADSTAITNSRLGVIPRACSDLFANIQTQCDGNAQVEFSYLEIYNEEIRDLLPATKSDNSNLKLRETLQGDVYVSGLTKVEVRSPDEIYKHMIDASSRRVVASTRMNAASSRSHALCILTLRGVLEDGTNVTSKLTFVDLAGSEKISKTGAEGVRLQEGIHINKGLFVLGQVIAALSEDPTSKQSKRRKRKRQKPPYRDSKLTRLLQNSIGGNSRTIMIACVSPDISHVEETMNTLRYATTARSIQNSATRNVVKSSISPEQVAKLERENQLLQQQVQQMRETMDAMIAEASDASSTTSIPSLVESSNDTASISFALMKPALGSSTTEYDEAQARRVAELEAQVEKLETKLHKATNNVRKSAKASAVELPALKMQVELMEDELMQAAQVKKENESMYQQLTDLKAEAESSKLAADKMYQLLVQLRQEKKDHDEWNKQETNKVQDMAKEGHSWSIFIILLLFFQLFLTCVGFVSFTNYDNSSWETQMAEIVESLRTLPSTATASMACPTAAD
eukprot:scaffold2047_cov129-Cylindrotheca_fusiformis.AAC.11